MCERERIIAVDFDGCLCENAWPEIGEARQDVIDALLLRQKSGAKIILWTCRVGEQLSAAVRWCTRHGIVFDAINENLPVNVAAFGNDCRKIFADEYWDDKACNPEICDVTIPLENPFDKPVHIYVCQNKTTVADGAVYDVRESEIAHAMKEADNGIVPCDAHTPFMVFRESGSSTLKIVRPYNAQGDLLLAKHEALALASILIEQCQSL